MAETSDEIRKHIEVERGRLGQNLNELESRLKRATDWRSYFDQNPMLMLGAAFGCGLLLSLIAGSNNRDD